MKDWTQTLTNYALFLAVLMLMAAFQSTLWLQLFGWFPAPQIWLTVLVFWVLYRELWESVLMMYIISVILTPFTALPFSHFLAINLLTCLGLVMVKRRVYWAGPTFFLVATAVAVFLFMIFNFLISWRYDRNPIRDFAFLQWLLTLLLTMLISLPFHPIFSWLDRLTHKEHPTEAGTGIL